MKSSQYNYQHNIVFSFHNFLGILPILQWVGSIIAAWCICFLLFSSQPPLLEDSKFFESLFDGEMANQAHEEWEKAMSELAQEEPELLQHFHKLSEAAGKVGKLSEMEHFINVGWRYASLVISPLSNCFGFFNLGTDVASQQEFTGCLKETLSGLAKNADNLQVNPFGILLLEYNSRKWWF